MKQNTCFLINANHLQNSTAEDTKVYKLMQIICISCISAYSVCYHTRYVYRLRITDYPYHFFDAVAWCTQLDVICFDDLYLGVLGADLGLV